MGAPVQITMDCADPARLAAFWALVLDYVEPPLFTIGPRTHRLSSGVAAVWPGRWPGAVARITVTTGA